MRKIPRRNFLMTLSACALGGAFLKEIRAEVKKKRLSRLLKDRGSNFSTTVQLKENTGIRHLRNFHRNNGMKKSKKLLKPESAIWSCLTWQSIINAFIRQCSSLSICWCVKILWKQY